MDDREGWQERVREICAGSSALWWWWNKEIISKHVHVLPFSFLLILIYSSLSMRLKNRWLYTLWKRQYEPNFSQKTFKYHYSSSHSFCRWGLEQADSIFCKEDTIRPILPEDILISLHFHPFILSAGHRIFWLHLLRRDNILLTVLI